MCNLLLEEFRIYFLSNYYNIKEHWAYAYRKNCHINTNMHLDKSIAASLRFIRDKTIERIIKLSKGKNLTTFLKYTLDIELLYVLPSINWKVKNLMKVW